MKERRTWILLSAALLLFLLAAPPARADAFTLATIPASGAISGLPGATIGWGYTIMNLSTTDFLQLTAISAGGFVNGTPDASIFNFPTIGPNSSVTVPFVANLQGLYQLTWDPSAPIGFVNSGTFMVTGDFCTDASCTTVVLGMQSQSASYAATVAIPEPGTLLLVGAGVAGLLRRRRRGATAGRRGGSCPNLAPR
jgi:hypothetical protein